MAKVLGDFTFKTGSTGKKYPWDEWLDGQIRQLDADDFGGTDAKYVAHQARNTAKRRGKKVRVSMNLKEQTIVLQAIDASQNGHAEEAILDDEGNVAGQEAETTQAPKKAKKRK